MRFKLFGAWVAGAIVFGLLARAVGGGLDTQHFGGADAEFFVRFLLAIFLGFVALACAVGALIALAAKDDF
jgi:hypothetical protein